ncbi:MAG: AAA family ATPase [Pirellulaceae bacterium]|nr:AAA family ATPase [Pirellulaceae bacterium]
MRLKSIDIGGFRGFASRQKFDLSADATVIVGVNGLGKTSLLDAILWGLCGKVDRVGDDAKLVSLYSETGEARISIELESQSGELTSITRSSDGSKQSIQLSTGEMDFKGGSADARLYELCWPDAISASDSNASLTSAFVRSVYLQQDRVRDFLDASSDQDRFNIISELVGTGRLTELQLQLERERNSWTRATTQRKTEGKPLLDRVAELERQLQKIRQSSETLDEEGTPSWSEWWTAAKGLGIISPADPPSAASVEASNSLNFAIQELQSAGSQSERKRGIGVSLRTLLDEKPNRPEVSIDELRLVNEKAEAELNDTRTKLDFARRQAAENRRLQIETRELKAQQRALAQIALMLLGDHCPVCEQSYDHEQTKSRLERLVIPEETALTSATETSDIVSELAIEEEKFAKFAMDAKKLLDETRAKIASYSKWQDEVTRAISDLELEILASDLKSSHIDEIISSCTRRNAELLAHRKAGERLSLNLARESAKSRIATVETELQGGKTELEAHLAAVTSREATGEKTSLLLDALREAASRVAVDRLRQIEPFFQRVYARIDPHPAFRIVKLATRFSRGRGRLDTEVYDSLESVRSDNPSAVLSSSQLNALAVSLFLSLNLTLPKLPVEAALLDDPIQSLDDINLLGLVDLLRRTKDKRQLIVSTHDARFGKLLARKLRPGNKIQRTSVIELFGWSRRGPEVRQYDIQSEHSALRLVRAS